MRFFIRPLVTVVLMFLYTSTLFCMDSMYFSYDNVGRVGLCSAVLLSDRVAIVSAHCLLHDNKTLKPGVSEFVLSNQSIDIELAVLGTSDFAQDSVYNPLVLKDWAFIILKDNKYSKNRLYMHLSTNVFSSYLINKAAKRIQISSLNALGVDEDLNTVSEVCNVFNKRETDLLFTTCRREIGAYSGVLFDDYFNVSSLLSVSSGYYANDRNIPKGVQTIAIPITDSMIQVFQNIDQSIRKRVGLTNKNVIDALLGLKIMDESISGLTILNINRDSKTKQIQTVIKPLKSFRIVNRLNENVIRRHPFNNDRFLNDREPKRLRRSARFIE